MSTGVLILGGLSIIVLMIIVVVAIGSSTTQPTTAPTPATPTPSTPVAPSRTYTFYQGYDIAQNDITHDDSLIGNIDGLKAFCNDTPGCVAFNTNGWIKNKVLPRNQWARWENPKSTDGVYVLDGVSF